MAVPYLVILYHIKNRCKGGFMDEFVRHDYAGDVGGRADT